MDKGEGSRLKETQSTTPYFGDSGDDENQPQSFDEDEDIEVQHNDGEPDGQTTTVYYDSEYDMRSDTDLAIDVSVLDEGADVGDRNGEAGDSGIDANNVEEEGLRFDEEGPIGLDGDRLSIEVRGDGDNIRGGNCDKTMYVSDSGEEDVVYSGDEFCIPEDSDDEDGSKQYPSFSPADVFHPKFDVGMRFASKLLFRKAVQSHAINTHRPLKITKNDKKRVHAKCRGEGCDWRLHAVRLQGEETYQVCDYFHEHSCPYTKKLKNVKAPWISEKFVSEFKADPTRTVEGSHLHVTRNLDVTVSRQQYYRARMLAKHKIFGTPAEQYSLLCSFIGEVEMANPGSTLKLETNYQQGQVVFDRLNMCLAALKEGFIAGCRKLIGFDACWLKGPHKGFLLSAVGIDPNNNIYPIAWAVVEKESRDTWGWFMGTLKNDLNIAEVQEWTIMFDKHQGLINAVNNVFPGAEHRFCVKHMGRNFANAGFKGDDFDLALWKAARACTVNDWEAAMNEIEYLSVDARRWFNDKPPHQWSRSHFRTDSHCDILLNNHCESFNSCIMPARYFAILSMLEWLLEYVMKRHQKNRDRAMHRWNKVLCPKIEKKIEELQARNGDCTAIKSSDKLYSVTEWCGPNGGPGSRYRVNLQNKSCGCRKWDLSGIPCRHALPVLGDAGLTVSDYVEDCYKVETYRKAYAPVIVPINGRDQWKKSTQIPPVPPNCGRKIGRPQTVRMASVGETVQKGKKRLRGKPTTISVKEPNTMTRHQKTVRCSFCRVEGHNIKGCKKKKEEVNSQQPHVDEEVGASNNPPTDLHKDQENTANQCSFDDIDDYLLEDLLSQYEIDESLVETTMNAASKGKEKVNEISTKGKEKLPIRRSSVVGGNFSTMKDREKLIIGSKSNRAKDKSMQTSPEEPHVEKTAKENPKLSQSGRSENTTTSPFTVSNHSVVKQLHHSQVNSTVSQPVNIFGSTVRVNVQPNSRSKKAPDKSKPAWK